MCIRDRERQTSQAIPDSPDSFSGSGLSLQYPIPPAPLLRQPRMIRQNAVMNGFSDDDDDGFSQFIPYSPPPIQRVRPLRRSARLMGRPQNMKIKK